MIKNPGKFHVSFIRILYRLNVFTSFVYMLYEMYKVVSTSQSQIHKKIIRIEEKR